ncbi:MAG: hypothetical protein CYPHOPRED_002168 [Cyphobasidiales sp. Tagirdzhanova-0007]|nr:MAG: hypothetical protein CYPHOPRED_002168 [Cyphobasidiales sp. Tagirdzhanova-0007]
MASSVALSQSKLELLTKTVVFNHEIMTYRVAARLFKCCVQDAKSLLRAFHEQSDGRTHATWLITGFIKTRLPSDSNENSLEKTGNSASDHLDGQQDVAMESEENGPPPTSQPSSYTTELHSINEAAVKETRCIMLVQQEELDGRLPLFSQILSNEIYSVEPSRLPDLVLLTAANAPVLNDPSLSAVDSAVIGTIAHSRQETKKSTNTSKVSKASTSKASALKSDLKRKASSGELVPPASKAISASTTTKPVQTSKLATSTSSTNLGKGKGKDLEKEANKASSNLDDLFKDDKIANKTETPVPPMAPSDGREKQKQQGEMEVDVEDDYAGMLADDDEMIAELDRLDEPEPDKAAMSRKSAEKPKSQTMKSSQRKRRKIVRKEVTTNAKGFKVTKDVETDESYSSSSDNDNDSGPKVSASLPAIKTEKGDSEVKSKKEKAKETTPAASSASNGNNQGTKGKAASKSGAQTSLGSFFSKPKGGKKQ